MQIIWSVTQAGEEAWKLNVWTLEGVQPASAINKRHKTGIILRSRREQNITTPLQEHSWVHDSNRIFISGPEGGGTIQSAVCSLFNSKHHQRLNWTVNLKMLHVIPRLLGHKWQRWEIAYSINAGVSGVSAADEEIWFKCWVVPLVNWINNLYHINTQAGGMY